MTAKARALRAAGISIPAVAIVVWGGLSGCSSRETTRASQGALHGVGPTPDGTFTSVVEIGNNGCSAALLSDSTAITAAHCFAMLAHRCDASADETPGVTLELSLDGQTTTVAYAVDQIVTHPRSYLNLRTCGSTDPNNCTANGSDDTIGHVDGFDLALLHFTVANGQSPPSALGGMSMFHPLITSVVDSAASPAGTVHVLGLDFTQVITASTNAWMAGWGNSDYGSWSQFRFAGTDAFWNPGATFGQHCDVLPTCNNAANPNISCNGNLGQFADQFVSTMRWGNPGSYSGPTGDSGDSGSPVFVHAGNGAGDISALNNVSGGPFFQIGIASISSDLLGGGVQIDAGTQVYTSYAPTWTADTGLWIDATLAKFAADLDGDGVPNATDNCPNLPNISQLNANLLAEQTLSDAPAGDACDVNATTRGTPGGEWNSQVSAPCTHVVINANQTFTLSSSGSCPVVYNTAITMRGNIGNAAGNAATANGESVPSYCDCPFANTASSGQCAAAPFNCVVAVDSADKYLSSPTPSGWITITQFANGVDQLYAFQGTRHEDPSDWALLTQKWTNQDVTSDWDYMADTAAAGHSGANSLLGQLWTHLPPDAQHFFPAQGESLPAINRPSHYTDFYAFQHPGYTFSTVPPLVNRWVPFWVKVIKTGPEAPYLLPGTDAVGAEHVLDQSTAGPMFVDARFDSSALSALASVGQQTNDLFVADEAVAGDGALPASAVRAIATFTNDTSIHAGFTQAYQVVTGTTTSNGPTSTGSYARTYSATTGKLYALRTNRVGWLLYAYDVPSALAGSPTSTSVGISGVRFSSPAGMAYDVIDGNLYVVDKPVVNSLTTLRLSRLSTSGAATVLWQTTGDSAPPTAYLTVSSIGELVLGLGVGTQSSEVALLDTNGHPWWSTSTPNQMLARPVANESGVSILKGNADQAYPTTYVARSSLTHGLCGTTWLQAHVDPTTVSPLGYPGGDCP